jgi:hypothetical protein
MKKLILGLIITMVVNVISLNAQPFRIATVTLKDKKENKPRDGQYLEKRDFITEKQDKKEGERAYAKDEKQFNKLRKKEIKNTRRLARRYEKNHGLSVRRHHQKVGI